LAGHSEQDAVTSGISVTPLMLSGQESLPHKQAVYQEMKFI